MHTPSDDNGAPLRPQLCAQPVAFPPKSDDGITMIRGILVAGTASLILWGIGIVAVMLLR